MTDNEEIALSQEAKARVRRRADALRANLRRRKQQTPAPSPALNEAAPSDPDSADQTSSALT